MGDALLAASGWLIVFWLPGVLMSVALVPNATFLRSGSIASLVGAGMTMTIAQLLSAIGARVEPATVLPITLGISLTVWLSIRFVRRGMPAPAEDRPARTTAVDRWWLLGSAALGLSIWLLTIPSLSDVVPFIDGAHHGLFAQRILTQHTLDPHKILVADPGAGSPSLHYYPLALHLGAALISAMTGVAVNGVLVVATVLAGSVLLPVGTFALTRRLVPADPRIARVAALVSAVVPWLPFSPLLWGGIPLIVSMCQVPAAVDWFWSAIGHRFPVRLGVVLGIAIFGQFAIHNTEAVTVVVFAAVLVVSAWRQVNAQDRRNLARCWVVAGIVGAVLVSPNLTQLASGLTERGGQLGQGAGAGLSPSDWFIAAANPVLLLFALIGLGIIVRRRELLGWLACLAISLGLIAIAITRAPLLRSLTVPWYSNTVRLSYLFVYFETVFVAIGIMAAVDAVARRASRTGSMRPAVALALPAVVIALAGIVGVVPLSSAFVSTAYSARSLVGPNERAAFAWLREHAGSDDRVLNQFSDDSAWMATLSGVQPLFALYPDLLGDPQRTWGDRWYLLTHAASLATDGRAQRAVRAWHVRYAYVGDAVFTHQPRYLSAAALARSGAYRLVWHRSGASIFEVVA